MTDIFFSYSSADRERVRPIRDALVAQGFEVFWDQEVPTGLDWDSWIRQHLAKSKCAMAFWSIASVASDNVRHEAMVAKQQGKLISVLLEPLTIQQFPMGLYAQQAANLANWDGDPNHNEWRKLRREFEAKLIPTWVRQQLDELEAELVGERARREGAERRDKTLQAQIAKEAQVQQDLKRKFNNAADEVVTLKATVAELTQARTKAEVKHTEAQHALIRERDSAREEVAALKKELSQVRQNKARDIARYVGAALSPLVIAAAVATVGFWTYQFIWPAPQPTSLTAAEAERLTEEAQRQAKAATESQTKLQAAQAEQQQQVKAVADADLRRKAAEAEQQRLKEEVQRQTKAAADADAKRRAAEAEQQRLAVALRAEQEQKAKSVPTVTTGPFMRRPNEQASGYSYGPSESTRSIGECEQKCAQAATCKVFTYNKINSSCSLYTRADFIPNADFDSGIRN